MKSTIVLVADALEISKKLLKEFESDRRGLYYRRVDGETNLYGFKIGNNRFIGFKTNPFEPIAPAIQIIVNGFNTNSITVQMGGRDFKLYPVPNDGSDITDKEYASQS